MKASDIMVANVISVPPNASVREVARVLLSNQISAMPVLDELGRLIGIVSEGDLMRRAELDTEHRRSWWLRIFSNKDKEALAVEFMKSHSQNVQDVMTRDVITAAPDTPLREIAAVLEKKAHQTSSDCGRGRQGPRHRQPGQSYPGIGDSTRRQ